MDAKSPKMRKLEAHIINWLGGHKTCLAPDLKGGIRRVYSNVPKNYVDQAVTVALGVLERKGIVRLRHDDNIDSPVKTPPRAAASFG